MSIKELYLKTIFCSMACDGDIATEEVAMVREMTSGTDMFGELDVETIVNNYIEEINSNGVKFLNSFLNDLSDTELSDEEQLTIVDLSVKTIEADNKIEYSEVKFFKKIRNRLSISDASILAKHSDIEDWLLPDINITEDPVWDNAIFENISLNEGILEK